jgi:hypothetical protein
VIQLSLPRQRPTEALYLVLFAAQISGVALLIWNGLPVFRQLAAHPGEQIQSGFLDELTLSGALLLMQGAYWYRFLRVPIPFRGPSVILNHVFIFLARLGLFLEARCSLSYFFDTFRSSMRA